MEQQLPACLGEWEIAEFVEDGEVEAGQLVGDGCLAAGSTFGLKRIDEAGAQHRALPCVDDKAQCATLSTKRPLIRPTHRVRAGRREDRSPLAR
jgi:hypothetical protein